MTSYLLSFSVSLLLIASCHLSLGDTRDDCCKLLNGNKSYCKTWKFPATCQYGNQDCTSCLTTTSMPSGPTTQTSPLSTRPRGCDAYCVSLNGAGSYCKSYLTLPVCQGGNQDCSPSSCVSTTSSTMSATVSGVTSGSATSSVSTTISDCDAECIALNPGMGSYCKTWMSPPYCEFGEQLCCVHPSTSPVTITSSTSSTTTTSTTLPTTSTTTTSTTLPTTATTLPTTTTTTTSTTLPTSISMTTKRSTVNVPTGIYEQREGSLYILLMFHGMSVDIHVTEGGVTILECSDVSFKQLIRNIKGTYLNLYPNDMCKKSFRPGFSYHMFYNDKNKSSPYVVWRIANSIDTKLYPRTTTALPITSSTSTTVTTSSVNVPKGVYMYLLGSVRIMMRFQGMSVDIHVTQDGVTMLDCSDISFEVFIRNYKKSVYFEFHPDDTCKKSMMPVYSYYIQYRYINYKRTFQVVWIIGGDYFTYLLPQPTTTALPVTSSSSMTTTSSVTLPSGIYTYARFSVKIMMTFQGMSVDISMTAKTATILDCSNISFGVYFRKIMSGCVALELYPDDTCKKILRSQFIPLLTYCPVDHEVWWIYADHMIIILQPPWTTLPQR